MEHAIHVAGGHFIRTIGPTSTRTVTRDDEDHGEDGGVDFDVGDTVGKALALVTQVSSGCY
jgi:hypothetical protein